MKNNSKSQEAELASQMAVDNSLETVRDILFGAQVRETEKRDAELELLIKNTADKLRKDFDQQIHSLELALQQMQASFNKRAEASAAEVADRFQHLDEVIAKLDSTTKAAQHDLYETLNAEREALAQQAAGWNEDLARQLELVQQQLQHSKADRTTLAQLLQTMATSLLGEQSAQAPSSDQS
ncbi:hypothetical protein G8764_06725 [Pseudomaricurvus alcaniphilus]|uniref:hypothetical protein n=1 Tax=Pseudomaricurvus alcaniphilus TaxID=1166482 RepID=UPI00140E4566|nr:hypothetical protein [Pseudomaricurvus alcaniphilus]NHN36978.1 hypothetical protein [Pseudomaricurvus alcaniphilus]